jgi:hypothetical protein
MIVVIGIAACTVGAFFLLVEFIEWLCDARERMLLAQARRNQGRVW